MRKQSIINEMDDVIYNQGGKVSFRNIAKGIGISASTISYQFKSQVNLYDDYIAYKYDDLVYNSKSFTAVMSDLAQELVLLFNHLADEVAYLLAKRIIVYLNEGCNQTVSNLYIEEFPNATNSDKTLIIAGVMNCVMFSDVYQESLDLDFSNKSNCEQLVKLVISKNV